MTTTSKKNICASVVTNMDRIITLTTDFGLTDEYVGVMKGVILSRRPSARIVDLTHNIGRHDILQAAYVIYSSYRYFPESTIHIVVVDPGVGSDRRIVLVSAKNHLFLVPDNGLLSLFLINKYVDAAYEVNCDHLFLKPLSNTFHGRDIFAPVAAQLAGDFPPEQVGNGIDPDKLVILSMPEVRIDPAKGRITGTVLRTDSFGNLMTNIHRDDVSQLFPNDLEHSVSIRINERTIKGIRTSYAASSTGSLLALFGSRDFMEISVNRGNAAEALKAMPDNKIVVISEGKA